FVGQPPHRGLQILDVAPHRRVPLVDDGSGADVDAVSAIAAATARPFGDALGPDVIVGERPVLAARTARVALLTHRHRLAREAVEALDDVAEEARFTLLAVGHDVDAGVGLPSDDVGDGVADELRVGLAVVRLDPVPRFEDGNESIGARQAAHVRGQDPFRASLHRRSPFSGYSYIGRWSISRSQPLAIR